MKTLMLIVYLTNKGKPPRIRRARPIPVAATPEIPDAKTYAEYQASVQALPGYEPQALEYFRSRG